MIALNGVCVQFGPHFALQDVTVTLEGRGIVAIVGPNGSGKSTLLDVLSGFISPTSGTLCQAGRRKRLWRHEVRSLAARLHQAVVVPPEASVNELLQVAAAPTGLTCLGWQNAPRERHEHHERILRFLQRGGISGMLLDKPMQELSWGQNRLGAIAAVMTTNRPMVLLDEPFAGLSEAASSGLTQLLKGAAKERFIVLVEHELDRVAELADRVLVLVRGKLVRDWHSGPPFTRSDLIEFFGVG